MTPDSLSQIKCLRIDPGRFKHHANSSAKAKQPMPRPEISNRNQRALLWEKTGDDPYAEPLLSDPVELKVRWESAYELTVTDERGNVIGLEAIVVVDRDITVGSLMWLAPDSSYSALQQWLGTGSGNNVDNDRLQVFKRGYVPSLRKRFIRRTVYLTRFRSNT